MEVAEALHTHSGADSKGVPRGGLPQSIPWLVLPCHWRHTTLRVRKRVMDARMMLRKRTGTGPGYADL